MVTASAPRAGLRGNFRGKPWYMPTFSPEHGVLLVLAGGLLTGASLAQAWTWETGLAALAALLGLQAEHPFTVQVKQRRQWRPRYVVWALVYGLSAIAIMAWLTLRHPALLWVCMGAAVAMAIHTWAVFRHKQKAIPTELLMFSAICLSTPLAYSTTAHSLSTDAVGLWLLNALFFCSAVFTIKLRKARTSSLSGALIYHSTGAAMVVVLCWLGWLPLLTALTFAIALLKLAVIIGWRDWYCNCRFEYIARFETYFALSYTALACLTLLPARLPVT